MSVLISIFVWRLPIKIAKYVLNLEPAAEVDGQRSPRRRPLHTCGASLVAATQIACTKLQGLDGPLGTTAVRIVSLMNLILPFVYSLLYPMFPLLLVIDDHILIFESKAEEIFPPSTLLFDKLDGLVCSTESLPEHVDRVMTILPSVVKRFSLLDRVFALLVTWLNLVISVVTRLVKEKEKPVEARPKRGHGPHHNHSVDRLRFLRNQTKVLEEPTFADSPKFVSYQSANSSPMSDCSEGEISSFNRAGKTEMSYKEVLLEKGQREEGKAEAAETVGKNSNENSY